VVREKAKIHICPLCGKGKSPLAALCRRCRAKADHREVPPKGQSGYKGVVKLGKKWAAVLHHHGKQYLGTFDSPESAAAIYNIHARRAYGKDAYQNQLPTEAEAR